MMTFEKGLSYNFMVERIAEVKGNHYYVIQVEHKECWVKMYPFEKYQSEEKKMIRCEYRGLDSFGSHIFIEDRLSILYELYEENKSYDFSYIEEGIDTKGYHFSVLKDKYGLTHRFYKQLLPEQKDNKIQIKCTVTAIDGTTKALILQQANPNNEETNIPNNNTIWLDAETVFKSIGKEQLLNEYFYNNLDSCSKYQLQNNFTNLYHTKNKEWITSYLSFLDRRYKNLLVVNGDLYKLDEFADLMICLVNWAKTLKIIKCKKRLNLSKYEGLKKAIKVLQTDSLNNYKETLFQTDSPISETSTIFSLIEIDKALFGKNFSLHKELSIILYNSIMNMDSSDTYQKGRKEKRLKAFQYILSNRIQTECRQILQEYNVSAESLSIHEIFSILHPLLKASNHINSQTIQSYIDDQPPILSAIACIIYGYKQLNTIDRSNELIIRISNILNLSMNCGEKETENKEAEIREKNTDNIIIQNEQHYDLSPKQPDETKLYLNLYENNTYIITEKPINENNIIQNIDINPTKDIFILQCYEHGSVNKVPIRMIKEKRKNKRYLNGCYTQDYLKKIFIISEETYIAIISLYNNNRFIKLYSTKYISEHSALGLKGNQVVSSNVDSTEYFLISKEHISQLPKRLIYSSFTPIGKDMQNLYYENDILTLKNLGILKE